MTPFMAFFTYAVKGFETGEVTGTQTSFAVISENGYEITGILFEKWQYSLLFRCRPVCKSFI